MRRTNWAMLSALASLAAPNLPGLSFEQNEEVKAAKKTSDTVVPDVQSLASAEACLTAAEAKRLRRIERNKKIQEKQNG